MVIHIHKTSYGSDLSRINLSQKGSGHFKLAFSS
jgi:hypothetical protein